MTVGWRTSLRLEEEASVQVKTKFLGENCFSFLSISNFLETGRTYTKSVSADINALYAGKKKKKKKKERERKLTYTRLKIGEELERRWLGIELNHK